MLFRSVFQSRYRGERKKIEELILELNLKDHVRLIGWVNYSKLPAYFATADIFIGPSIQTNNGDREGFGLTFAEAISSECIVIASDLPAIKDIIIENQTGFIVKQKSSKAISDKVIELIKFGDNLEIFKDRGRKFAKQNFDWKTISTKYGRLLK